MREGKEVKKKGKDLSSMAKGFSVVHREHNTGKKKTNHQRREAVFGNSGSCGRKEGTQPGGIHSYR